ncbi:NlpC/P60 family protein [uncultured Eubacterium sp.]|uniref:C40 family peptidase n=1 Tax=uncultured Eubacterium sp. TaxID=165185 RepID=UPI0026017353|nr:NlpC/P60 family protein [uncultured Eubacterium sp.]
MKINKEQEVKTEIHKKKTGKIHKKNEAKIDNKSMTTRAKRSVNLAVTMAESTITENVEGGENIDEAFEATGIATRPVKGVISEGNRIRKKVSTSKLQKEVAGKRIRKKASTKGKELAKKSVKNTSRNVAKKTSKKVVKDTTKEGTKLAVKIGTTAAGPEGTLIGMAAGEAVGMKIENTFYRAEQKSRMMKYFMDKLKPGEEQNDSIFKLVRSLIKNKMAYMIKQVASLLAPLVVPILVVVMVATGIVFPIIAVLYNSPFAIFLPPLESGDTIKTVTTQYVAEFNQEIQTLVDEHKDADEGRKVYVDYEGMNSEPSNYYDIMCVYMVKYGYENTATKMNETNKQNLKAVFDDMCKYTTEKVTEKKYLEVRITLKSYTEMSVEYQFDEERKETLNQLMSACITSNPSSGQTGGSQLSGLQGSLTPQEITSITDKITNPTQKAVASFVLSKVGYPYSQNLRNSGKAFDCSSLAYYAWKSAGIDIAFGGSTTAAAEAEGLKDKSVKEENLQPGDLIFYSYTTNGRYKNISHVGIYVGNGKMVEAVDEAHGVCLGNYHNGGLVMICRPGK